MRSIEYGESFTTGFEPPQTRAARDTGQDPGSHNPREMIRAAKGKSQLQFQVRTLEGDTVALSVNALQEVALVRAAAAGAGASGGSHAVATAYSPPLQRVELHGPLSEAELQGLQNAILEFSQGEALASPALEDYSCVSSAKRASSHGELRQK